MNWLPCHATSDIAEIPMPLGEWIKLDAKMSVTDYVKGMRVSGWGGVVEMVAYSRCFDRQVHVWVRTGAGAPYLYKRIARLGSDQSRGPPLHVLYVNGDHYDARCPRLFIQCSLRPRL